MLIPTTRTVVRQTPRDNPRRNPDLDVAETSVPANNEPLSSRRLFLPQASPPRIPTTSPDHPWPTSASTLLPLPLEALAQHDSGPSPEPQVQQRGSKYTLLILFRKVGSVRKAE